MRWAPRLTWFGVVGASSALCYAGAMTITISEFSWPPPAGNALAYLLSMSVSYFGHKILTFRSSVAHHRAVPRFLAQSAIGYLYAAVAVHAGGMLRWPYGVAIGFVTLSLPVLNFVVLDRFVFAAGAGAAAGAGSGQAARPLPWRRGPRIGR